MFFLSFLHQAMGRTEDKACCFKNSGPDCGFTFFLFCFLMRRTFLQTDQFKMDGWMNECVLITFITPLPSSPQNTLKSCLSTVRLLPTPIPPSFSQVQPSLAPIRDVIYCTFIFIEFAAKSNYCLEFNWLSHFNEYMPFV